MKGLVSVALAASLSCVGAFAQSAGSAPQTTIGKIAGKKFVSADGASLTIVAFKGGLAREIHEPDGAVVIETFALANGRTGTVSDAEDSSRTAGRFQLTPAGLTTIYSDGRSETMIANAMGGVSMELRGSAGERTCTAWYPEGHRFSDAERQVALLDIADRLDLDAPQSSAKQSCDPDSGTTHEAQTHARRHVAQTAPSSHRGESVVARLPE
jgi:hypothetical protein